MASINKNNQGLADFEAQAIKISGGIIPKTVSEAKKNENLEQVNFKELKDLGKKDVISI